MNYLDGEYPALYAAIDGPDLSAWLTRKEQTYGDHTEVWSVMNAEIATWVGFYPYKAPHYSCLICRGETACPHIQAVQVARRTAGTRAQEHDGLGLE